MLYHYFDNFVAIFQVKNATSGKMSMENKVYIQLIDLLSIPQNNSKDI